jgi:hypothetical protein
MLQLFVAPTPFEGWGEYPHDGTTLSLIVIVSVGALALTLCVALVTLFGGQPLEPPDQNRSDKCRSEVRNLPTGATFAAVRNEESLEAVS